MSSNIIRGLEIDLYGEMIMDEQKGISRRGFLKGLIGAGGSLMVPGVVKKAFAGGSSLPPGIAMSTDAIKRAWTDLMNGDFHDVKIYLNLINERYQNNIYVRKDNEPVNEPATYLILAMIGNPARDYAINSRYGNLSASDPMVDWAYGISNYVYNWISNDKPQFNSAENQKYIEIPLLSSIFKSAGRDASDVRGYLAMENSQKEQFLQGVMSNLKRTGHREQLIAAWASTWLTNHYFLNKEFGKEQNGGIMNRFEIGLKKITNMEIRGPPYYYDDKGSFKA